MVHGILASTPRVLLNPASDMKKIDAIDCIEMKRHGSLRIHELLRDKTPAEQLKFWQERTEALKQHAKDQPAEHA